MVARCITENNHYNLRPFIFMPPPTDRCVEGIMFSGCPSVCASVQACVLSARYLANQWTEFHQTLVDDVVKVQMNWLDFESRGVKVKVTARSDIWVSYCLGVWVSCSFPNQLFQTSLNRFCSKLCHTTQLHQQQNYVPSEFLKSP